ncbi:MAG: hypothetical protein JNM18_02530 [Planctomycetaceae bacterium]|nr:hypothetical protein [Planctomycetaceae bacterium]
MLTAESRWSRRGLCHAMLALVMLVAQPVGKSVADSPCPCGADITGCWECGSWRSYCTGHHGKLRARIVRCGCEYECHFSGTFFKFIAFRYSVTLQTTGVGDGVVYFRASKNIPFFGGSFDTCGHATNCKFVANYTSKKDRGLFEMSR